MKIAEALTLLLLLLHSTTEEEDGEEEDGEEEEEKEEKGDSQPQLPPGENCSILMRLIISKIGFLWTIIGT